MLMKHANELMRKEIASFIPEIIIWDQIRFFPAFSSLLQILLSSFF